MSDAKFRPESIRIAELLSASSSNQYVIPDYQRDYDWDEDSASEFINDIIDAKQDKNEKILFLGTMIFYVNKDNKKPIDFKQSDGKIITKTAQIKEVIDGQQRLTTIIILLIALGNVMRSLSNESFKITAMRVRDQIQLCIPDFEAYAKELRLVPSESIKDLLTYMSTSDWTGKFEFPNDLKIKPEAIKIIKPIYDIFISRIDEKLKAYNSDEEEENFCSTLLGTIRQTEIIIIEIDDRKDAFDIFERNNARGLELETSDLLKNYLFSHADPIRLPAKTIKKQWETIVGNSEKNVVRMIRYFYISHEAFVRKNALYKKLKDYSEKKVDRFLIDLVDFSKFYNTVLECDDEEEIRNLFPKESSIYKESDKFKAVRYHLEGIKLTKTYIAYPLLDSALRNYKRTKCEKPKSLIKLFRQIENFHFIYAAKRDIETLYSKYCKKYNAEDADFFITTTALYKELNDLLNREEFISKFIQKSYKDKELISYIFDRFHNHKAIMKPTITVPYYDTTKGLRKRSFNIEHWLPTSSKAEDKATKDNIGNLLLVPWEVNSKLDDYSPIEKSELPSSSDWEVEFDDSIYMHPLKEFIKEYAKKTENFKKWGKKEIEGRAKDLAVKAFDEIWKFDKNVY